MVEILKLKFDQDLWYGLNPRVCSAFGNVFIKSSWGQTRQLLRSWVQIIIQSTLKQYMFGDRIEQSNFFWSYHKFSNKSLSEFIFIFWTKQQLQNLNRSELVSESVSEWVTSIANDRIKIYIKRNFEKYFLHFHYRRILITTNKMDGITGKRSVGAFPIFSWIPISS